MMINQELRNNTLSCLLSNHSMITGILHEPLDHISHRLIEVFVPPDLKGAVLLAINI